LHISFPHYLAGICGVQEKFVARDQKTWNVLFIGNSFTFMNDCLRYLFPWQRPAEKMKI
jgi:hypothetical protein